MLAIIEKWEAKSGWCLAQASNSTAVCESCLTPEESEKIKVGSKKQIAEKSIIKKYRKSIWRPFTRALDHFSLIEDGDHIAVAMSGGKDSLLLAKLMQEVQRHGKVAFKLSFITLDPGYNEANLQLLKSNAVALGIDLTIWQTALFNSIEDMQAKYPCYLCAKMRRGFLYDKAQQLGANKVALGHHLDDVVETVLMNVLYAGNFMTMMPYIKSTNFANMALIRPMYYIEEQAIVDWLNYNAITALDCACAVAAKKVASSRAAVKALIAQLAVTNPNIKKSILKSTENIHLDAVLGFKRRGKKYRYADYNQSEKFNL